MTYTISEFRRDMRSGPYAWPCGYPLYFIMADGEALSFAAARENCRLILGAIQDHEPRDQWRIVGVDINWEDTELTCAHTGERIQSAYGDD